MKQLIAGVVILVVVAVAGFLYRNTFEHPVAPGPGAGEQVACTQEAKICPNGASVGRTGPTCAFAACPPPNVEDSAIHLAFVAPAGYTANAAALGADETLRAVFDKPSKTEGAPHAILIREYPITAGKTAT